MSHAPHFGSADAKLPSELDLLIVGGGVMGLSLAYNLARAHAKHIDPKRIAVVERSYLVSGASGRNGGGLRMQWGDAGNVALMRESIEICRGLAQELDINLWFRQGGYLFLARTESGERRLHRNVAVHEEVGVATRLLAAREALALVPQLDVSEVRVAAYNPDDGVVFPWPFVWGYAKCAVERGVTIRTHTQVTGLEPGAGLDDSEAGGYRVRLSTGESLRAARVVNATGAWSVGINRSVSVELPNHPHRHEILSSEPLKPFLDPLVVDLETGLYFSQSTRGEIVTGITLPDPPGQPASDAVELGSSLRFLSNLSRALIRVLPIARQLKPLRQWSGPYDLSPDGDAMVGPSPDHPDLIQVCGFTGHGFMMAPAVGRLLARWLATGEAHPMLERWDPARFRDGRQLRREDMIIG